MAQRRAPQQQQQQQPQVPTPFNSNLQQMHPRPIPQQPQFQQMPQQQIPQQQTPPMRPGAGLPFLSFDIGNTPPPSSSSSFSGPPLHNPSFASASTSSTSGAFFEDEPPLLEELGINPSQILQKTKSVLIPFKRNLDLHEDADLSGPFLFCIMFGLCQLLAGKLHFGVILGWGSLASAFLYTIANLLSGPRGTLDLYKSFSLVGYSLLPMVLFSALALLVPRQGPHIFILAGIIIFWCTWSCTRLLVVLAPDSSEQKRLVAYGCLIIYLAFALLVVF